ncbi:MAG: hypothetical protein M3Q03_07860 [Chloroflexota bacterium]|nr:hypothetical protein [Chloroflexota bacterium]
MSEQFAAIADAIDNRLVVTVRYKDQADARAICPVRIGVTDRGAYAVLAYQAHGHSESSLRDGGRGAASICTT